MQASSRIVEYLQHAERCEWWAQRAPDFETRTGYEFLANQWRKLAEQEARRTQKAELE